MRETRPRMCECVSEQKQKARFDEAGLLVYLRRISDQCLKCRMPVKIMAMSFSSAAAITSSSRIEPPG